MNFRSVCLLHLINLSLDWAGTDTARHDTVYFVHVNACRAEHSHTVAGPSPLPKLGLESTAHQPYSVGVMSSLGVPDTALDCSRLPGRRI